MGNFTVREFLNALPHRINLSTVRRSTPLKEVVRTMVAGHRRRVVYVVDAAGILQGAIFLDSLKDTIFRHYLESKVGDALVVTERLMEIFASEKAEDVMETGLPTCQEHESLQEVISRLIEGNLKDLPVLDRDGRLIADLDILCLLELWLLRGGKLIP
jgi:CBS domain-containing protein